MNGSLGLQPCKPVEAMCASTPRRRFYATTSHLCLNESQEKKTFNKGSLGSRIDEERSEARNVVWIAEHCESSNL